MEEALGEPGKSTLSPLCQLCSTFMPCVIAFQSARLDIHCSSACRQEMAEYLGDHLPVHKSYL